MTNVQKKTIIADPSSKFSLNWIDAGKGFLTAAFTAVIFFIQQTLDTGSLQFHWKGVTMAAIGGGIGYLIKNFLSGDPRIKKDVTKNTDTKQS